MVIKSVRPSVRCTWRVSGFNARRFPFTKELRLLVLVGCSASELGDVVGEWLCSTIPTIMASLDFYFIVLIKSPSGCVSVRASFTNAPDDAWRRILASSSSSSNWTEVECLVVQRSRTPFRHVRPTDNPDTGGEQENERPEIYRGMSVSSMNRSFNSIWLWKRFKRFPPFMSVLRMLLRCITCNQIY